MFRPEPSAAEQEALAPKRGLGHVARLFAADIELRAQGGDSTLVDFYGHACVTGIPYEMYGGPEKGGWNETVDAGAFTKTLSENADVAFKINHEGMTLARTKADSMQLAEDKIGLEVKAALDTRVSIVNDMALLMEARALDEMSMAFRVMKQLWLDADGEEVPWWDLAGIERHLVEVSLHKGDVSVVNYGANPYTDAGLRSLEEAVRKLADGADLEMVARSIEHLRGLLPDPVVEDGAPAMAAYYANLTTLYGKRLPAA